MMSAVSGHYGLFEAIRYKRHRQAMLLAEAGIDVDCRNERGQTPLIYTVVAVDDCSRSRTKLVRLFLEAGADPNAADWKGLTALMHASILGQAETVKALLECVWTNPCLTDPNGNTALMYAASHGHHEVISVFLSIFRNNLKSLQLHKRNNDGFTALHLAVRNRHESCARLLTKEGQFFPTAIEEFPDPKDLDREPTPTETNEYLERKLNSLYTTLKPKHRLKSEDKRTTGTMTVDFDDLDFINCSSLSVLECNVGDLPISNYTHPFGLQMTKSTQVISVGHRKNSEQSSEVKNESTEAKVEGEDTESKADDWPAVPIQLKSASQKLLQPLIPIEIANAPNQNGSTFHRKCLLKQNNRGMSAIRIKIRGSNEGPSNKNLLNAHSTSSIDNIIAGSSIKSVHLKRNKQTGIEHETVSNLLPLIPCKDTSLPPVKYSFRRNGSSKKETMCFSTAPIITVRADQTPREIEIFKKNVVALS
ncbi:ANK_REP_REGION domain-containing protein [Nephila pilipes]|uniref:ANK_REP_REGION domain-containing protein n=1 Tax=Nephila pilipes TaxID=299642 RepID=A0A8X6TJ06_NEPPI|nr:ANK_REP_REGION domain-containing protein [Nephila pilipes]